MVCDKKVIFCSTVFKNEGFLHKSFENIKLLSELFSKVKILICYDNSGDKSLLELTQLKKEGFDIDIIINKKPRFISGMGRAYNIGQARNQILDDINDKYIDYDYFIMCDLDDVFNFKVHPDILEKYLQKIVSEMNEWDGCDIRPIDSYFNGFCIHKLDKFKDIRYYPATMIEDELIIDCEHRSFYKGANKKGLKVMFSKDCLFDEMVNMNLLNEK